MRTFQETTVKERERALCDSQLGPEILDVLAQANVDFRRLPPEEFKHLMAASSRSAKNRRRASPYSVR